MNFCRKTGLSLFALLSINMAVQAQSRSSYDPKNYTYVEDNTVLLSRKVYWASGIDAAWLSTAVMSRPGSGSSLTTLRFSAIGIGVNLHYDISRRVGFFTGLGIKNIGFIEKHRERDPLPDSTVKRRAYTVGMPLGIKIGDLRNRNFFFAGGGADLPFNYKEKGFVKRGDKDKFNEWFSERTPRILPYVFAGVSLDPGVTFKLQYYPTNFLNTGFREDGTGVSPYAGYNVNLIMLSLGIDIHYTTLPHRLKLKD